MYEILFKKNEWFNCNKNVPMIFFSSGDSGTGWKRTRREFFSWIGSKVFKKWGFGRGDVKGRGVLEANDESQMDKKKWIVILIFFIGWLMAGRIGVSLNLWCQKMR